MLPSGCDVIIGVRRNQQRRHGVNQVATVKQLAGGECEVTITGKEFALLRIALGEAERISRFGSAAAVSGQWLH
jgi:hypothetical protein